MKYQYKTEPRDYQRRALHKMVRVERGALWLPMRAGKTKIAVDWASVLSLSRDVTRVLVLTHTVTTLGVWRSEFEKHCPVDYSVGIQEPPEEGHDLEVMILNIQRVFDRERVGKSWQPTRSEMLYDWEPEMLIIDEATCVGDPSAIQTIRTYRLVQDLGIRYILELTGTPVHRTVFNAFGQFKILDDSIFGTAVTAYRQEYGVWGGFGNKRLIKLKNMKRWRRKVGPHVFQLYRIPYRKPQAQVIPVDMSPKAQRVYDEMAKEGVVTLAGSTVTAELPITRALKLAQIAAGFLKDDEGQWHLLGDHLSTAFRDTVQGLSDSEVDRIVVFARHLPGVKAAAKACQASGYQTLLLHGGVPQEKREQRIAAFHESGGKVAFVAQISTGSMGIDLSSADTTLYYELSESLLHKDQADARIRKHADKRPLTYYYFLPRGTILEHMKVALDNKMDMATYITKHPHLIHHKERG